MRTKKVQSAQIRKIDFILFTPADLQKDPRFLHGTFRAEGVGSCTKGAFRPSRQVLDRLRQRWQSIPTIGILPGRGYHPRRLGLAAILIP
jgi:hypothetical protein